MIGFHFWAVFAVQLSMILETHVALYSCLVLLFLRDGGWETGEFSFKIGDTLLFGRESAGVPNKVHETANEKLKIPMAKNKRSLNLATSVGIVLAEQIRQIIN